MADEIPAPESIEDVRERREQYQARVDEWNAEGSSSLGSVLLPPEDASDMAARAFHTLMTECGMDGIEYAQEGLHMNSDYFDDFFTLEEEVIGDFKRFQDNE